MLGKLLALPFKVLNVPAKIVGKVLDDEDFVFAKPLDVVVETLEEID